MISKKEVKEIFWEACPFPNPFGELKEMTVQEWMYFGRMILLSLLVFGVVCARIYKNSGEKSQPNSTNQQLIG